MRGRPPKPPHMRQNRNKVATRAQLPTSEEAAAFEVPEIPARFDGAPWHPGVLEWWREIWTSPMAVEFLPSDLTGGLRNIAMLYHLMYSTDNPKLFKEFSAEIFRQSAEFGLSSYSRRRLQWEIDKGEDAAARTERRRERQAKPDAGDPRGILKVV